MLSFFIEPGIKVDPNGIIWKKIQRFICHYKFPMISFNNKLSIQNAPQSSLN